MSNIEWTDQTWGPVIGCTKVSEGCRHCYAMRMAQRLAAMATADERAGRDPGRKGAYRGVVRYENGKPRPEWNNQVRTVPDALDDPLKWKKPRRVFVNSMSDLFHEGVPFDFIDKVFAAMALAPAHQFQILTKRPYRMRNYLDRPYMPGHICDAAVGHFGRYLHRGDWKEHGEGAYRKLRPMRWPLPNVWLGVSAEDHATADKRIPLLLDCPAAVRFVSAEPLIGPIDLVAAGLRPQWKPARGRPPTHPLGTNIDWVIVGGESGPGSRPCDLAWVRSLIHQCRSARVACFVKQLGACATDPPNGLAGARLKVPPEAAALISLRLTHTKGADPGEWPPDLRIRQWPNIEVKP